MNLFALFSNAAFQSGLLRGIIVLPFPLIALDFLSGIWAAACTHTFQVKKVADVLRGDLLKVIAALGGLGALSSLLNWQLDANLLAAVVPLCLLASSLVASIASNLSEVFPAGSPVGAEIQKAAEVAERDLQALPAWLNLPPGAAASAQAQQQAQAQADPSPQPRF